MRSSILTRHLGGVLAGVLLASCSSDSTDPPGEPELRATVVVDGLASPVHLTAPRGDGRLFIVEQAGRIRVVRNGQLLVTPFLDIAGKVRSGGEQGLLGLAFHPQYATNRYFYVNYTDVNGATRIERYTAQAGDPDRADGSSAKLILSVDQPFPNHNGGLLVFGSDDMLYIGMGDGGSGGDPQGHGQNLNTFLGALLRIDVNGGDPYAVPSNNPFRGQAGRRGEIWAYGLRNPWRFAFDRQASMLYIADVGQNRLEEINAVPSTQGGVNYGWNILEGSECFGGGTCNRTGLTLPVVEYDHTQGCSVTGGQVYRGRALSALAGHYFYADYCRGWVRSFRLVSGSATDQREWALGDLGNILSFGEDSNGELYILSSNGRVYRLDER